MPEKVWTAAELDQMTPAQRTEIFNASVVTDLDEVPPAFLAQVRERAQARIDGESTPGR